MTGLHSSSLSGAHDNVVIPFYSREGVTPGIVHLGLGGFARAHLAMYLDALLAAGGDPAWSLSGVGLMPGDAAMRDALAAQDRLYTLVTRATADDAEARIIGSIAEYLFAPDDPEAVIERLAAPTTHLVTLTVTEAGYGRGEHGFDLDRAGARADAQPGATPTTAWGFLAAALRRRRKRGLPAFTVLSCDNMPGNGEIARDALLGFASSADSGLAEWISAEVAFPSCMVDRITPATTDRDREETAALTGLDDRWPVCSERFAQWVIEDRFSGPRPPVERVGAQLVADVAPYEAMKLRLLNASHQVMSYLGLLAGFAEVHEVCDDPDLARFLVGYMAEEATPTLDDVPGIDLAAYRAQLLERFRNRAIRDTLARQVVDGSSRIPVFLLPVIADLAVAGRPFPRSALVLAGLHACLAGGAADPSSRLITADARLDELEAAAAADPGAADGFLDAAYGAAVPGAVRDAVRAAAAALRELGPREAVRSLAG